MRTVTVDEVLSWKPCPNYDRAVLQKLAGRRKKMTGLQILALKIPVEHRFWAILRHGFLSDKDLRLFACDCAEHVLGIFEEKYPKDKRPRECIAMARRFANGKATKQELVAAWVAAGAAAWAAGAAAWAAWAAGAAERAWQVKRLKRYLEAKP